MSALIAGGIVSGLLYLAQRMEGSAKAAAPVGAAQAGETQAQPDFAELQTANTYRRMVEDQQTFHTATPLPHATEAPAPSATVVRISAGGHGTPVAPHPVAPRPVTPAPARFGATASAGTVRTRVAATAERSLY